MSDFIYSTRNIDRLCMSKALLSIYEKDFPQVTYFSGSWGSLGITNNIYNGYEPYETKEYLIVVIGGPLLTFKENNFIKQGNNNLGTKAIFERWNSGNIIWDKDLNGPFSVLIINKDKQEVVCITDIMSFIPIFKYHNDNQYILSSHIDMMSIVTEKKQDFDCVSLADFILHGTVTYPYTTFKDVYQIQPASTHLYTHYTNEILVTSYWEPYENNECTDINQTAIYLRKCLNSYINMVTSQTSNIAQFISGGEDSRTLSGLLNSINRDTYIYLDSMNREGKIARTIANKYNANFKSTTRDQFHYLNIMEKCTNLIGSGAEYHHAHTYGFHKSLVKYDAVYGGLFSDALLKGARIKKTNLTKKFIFLSNRKNTAHLINENLSNEHFDQDIVEELKKRRRNHLYYIKTYRKESAEEWFELWPSSMNRNIPNIHANRRLFKSYEPFLSNEMVKTSARIPQKWKLNRALFHKIAKPYLKKSKWVLHGDGWYPYLSSRMNLIISFIIWIYRQVGKRVGYIKGNQGPWASWKKLINSDKWERKSKEYAIGLSYTNLNKDLKAILNNNILKKQLSTLQYIAFTQVLYQSQKGCTNEKKS